MNTITKLKSIALVAGISLAAVGTGFSQGTTATATLTEVSFSSGLFDYSLTLTDTSGTSPLGSLWYGWVPGGFFLPATPSSIQPPAGWTSSDIANNSIQWLANSPANYLHPGQSITFGFMTSSSPTAMAGTTTFQGNTIPVQTSVAYSAGLFSDNGFTFAAVNATPEPTSVALLAVGAAGLFAMGRRKMAR